MHNDEHSRPKNTLRYQVYLLRLWQERPGEPWRVLLQDPGSEQRRGFASVEECFAFIRERTRDEESDSSSEIR